jgi:hypothetical protein
MLNVQEVVKTKAYFVWKDRTSRGDSGSLESDWRVAQNLLGVCPDQVKAKARIISWERTRANKAGSLEGDWLEAERLILADRGIT